MSNTKTKYYTVYNMKYAIELKKMGHKVAETVPNPQKLCSRKAMHGCRSQAALGFVQWLAGSPVFA